MNGGDCLLLEDILCRKLSNVFMLKFIVADGASDIIPHSPFKCCGDSLGETGNATRDGVRTGLRGVALWEFVKQFVLQADLALHCSRECCSWARCSSSRSLLGYVCWRWYLRVNDCPRGARYNWTSWKYRQSNSRAQSNLLYWSRLRYWEDENPPLSSLDSEFADPERDSQENPQCPFQHIEHACTCSCCYCEARESEGQDGCGNEDTGCNSKGYSNHGDAHPL